MIKKSIVLHIMFILTIGGLLSSCNNQNADIDLDSVDLELKLDRFEQSLFQAHSVEEVLEVKSKFPLFYDVYLNNIMPQSMAFYQMSDIDKALELYKYIAHPDMDSLYKLTQKKYGEFESYREELEDVAKRIKYYMPDEEITRAVTFVSSFEYGSVFLEDSKTFAIGLDMYMGRDFEVYPLLDPSKFPFYRISRFESYYMVPNAVKSYLYYKAKKSDKGSFVDEAIYEGKILYAMDKLLPHTPDSLKISYAAGDIEWCVANEENIWGYLVQEDILFSTDKKDYIAKFFNDGPFTTPFGNESAPRCGAWVGWQIVREYMGRNPEVELADLLADQDHQKIFNQSKYKP